MTWNDSREVSEGMHGHWTASRAGIARNGDEGWQGVERFFARAGTARRDGEGRIAATRGASEIMDAPPAGQQDLNRLQQSSQTKNTGPDSRTREKRQRDGMAMPAFCPARERESSDAVHHPYPEWIPAAPPGRV